MLPKKYHLPKHRILSLIKTGRTVSSKDIRCVYALSEESNSRFAVIAKSQSPRSAVKRSRNKRTVQAAILLYLSQLHSSCDVIIFVYGKHNMYSPLEGQIQELFQKIMLSI